MKKRSRKIRSPNFTCSCFFKFFSNDESGNFENDKIYRRFGYRLLDVVIDFSDRTSTFRTQLLVGVRDHVCKIPELTNSNVSDITLLEVN